MQGGGMEEERMDGRWEEVWRMGGMVGGRVEQ
jgi:hypothetical protein